MYKFIRAALLIITGITYFLLLTLGISYVCDYSGLHPALCVAAAIALTILVTFQLNQLEVYFEINKQDQPS